MTAFIARGSRDPGAWNQRGVLVVQPTFVAFIPTGPRTHLAAIAAKAVLAGAGILVFRVGGRSVQPAELLAYLKSLDAAALLVAAHELVAQAGGVLWSAAEARYREEILPLGVRLSFVAPGDRLIVLDAKRVNGDPTYQAIVAAWPKVPSAPRGARVPVIAVAACVIGALLGVVGLASSAFTLAVVAAALRDGSDAGRNTSALFCCMDLMLLVPATALLAFGLRRLAAKEPARL